MKEIETQLLKHSSGVDDVSMTTSYACEIDLWLVRWKRLLKIKIRYYACFDYSKVVKVIRRSGTQNVQFISSMKIERRLLLVASLMKIKGIEWPPHDDADIPPLVAYHEKHLQEKVDLLEDHLCKIRGEHLVLADQLRSKSV
ncbi:uncharacterized protein LOC111831225 [Capsella rubella]|uniref:uncharacterized protein LOC111831225 n=1 Tax=Capsella rubella TaxID=81985 RepID=UPI000CD55622|nr:uncharacterized protein LOC111831225 [Capsella rubella]